jgi:hypothetical protein
MAVNRAKGLPAPPKDLAARVLPLKEVRGPVYRIHRSTLVCLHFSKDGSGRFDDPLKNYGVLYASLSPDAAFAEVFLRQLSLMLIQEADLQERSLSEIVCRDIRCVDLTGPGLRRLSCDNRISTEKPYPTTGLWSRALFDHPAQPAGIIYLSRHNPRFKCVALFDKCHARLKHKSTVGLLRSSCSSWTAAQVQRYKLAIQPAA